jgi:ABC-type multidrug transport system fused ATPase/permease subunit
VAVSVQAQFLEKNAKLIDKNIRAWWPIQVGKQWLIIRLRLTGQAIILTTAVFASLFVHNSGLAGLALTSALSMVGLLNWATRMGSEMEMCMNSVERMTEYLKYSSEAPPVIEGSRCPPCAPRCSAPTCPIQHASQTVLTKYR